MGCYKTESIGQLEKANPMALSHQRMLVVVLGV